MFYAFLIVCVHIHIYEYIVRNCVSYRKNTKRSNRHLDYEEPKLEKRSMVNFGIKVKGIEKKKCQSPSVYFPVLVPLACLSRFSVNCSFPLSHRRLASMDSSTQPLAFGQVHPVRDIGRSLVGRRTEMLED